MAAILRICFTCSSEVRPSLIKLARFQRSSQVPAHIFALMTQSKSSSPSSCPPGPPCTVRNNLGRQSTPSSARLAASSRCIFSIRDFSSVAALWSLFLMAMLTFSHNLTDSRSSCSATGLVFGYVSLAFDASKRRSFLPVCVHLSNRRQLSHRSTYCQIFNKHLPIPETSYLK